MIVFKNSYKIPENLAIRLAVWGKLDSIQHCINLFTSIHFFLFLSRVSPVAGEIFVC